MASPAHALDYDDVALAGHPSTVLVPAVLAEGEAVGASGLAAIRAYLVGYEVWAELIGRESDSHHTKGWHPTGVFGAVAAAAAAANLRGLDEDKARHALAIAASLAAGLTANFGTMTKPLHAGRAAANGIEAARLAQAGMTRLPRRIRARRRLSRCSIAGRQRRSQAAGIGSGQTARDPRAGPVGQEVPDVLRDPPGDRWRPRPGPCERRPGAATSSASRRPSASAQAAMLRNHAPVTGLEAKFSLEFAVACALVAGRVGLAELTDEFVAQPSVREAMGKLSIATTGSRCPLEPAFSFSDRVVLKLKDGRATRFGRDPLRPRQLPAAAARR